MKFSSIKQNFKIYCLREKGITPKYHKEITIEINKLCLFVETENIQELNENMVREYLNLSSEQKDWSAKTFRNKRQLIRSFFEWALKQGFAKRNPTDNIEKPKLPKPLPRFLTKDEIKEVLSTIDWIEWQTNFERARNKAIIATFLFTGIRHQELLNLRNEDVDFSAGNVLVRKGKGAKDRVVPIQSQLSPFLKTYIQSKKALNKFSVWFFHSSKSEKQLGQKDVRTICKRISKQSGIYFTPHMLRHTFGRLSVESNINIFGIQQIMGHSDIKTTQRYLSVSLKALKDEYAKVEFL